MTGIIQTDDSHWTVHVQINAEVQCTVDVEWDDRDKRFRFTPTYANCNGPEYTADPPVYVIPADSPITRTILLPAVYSLFMTAARGEEIDNAERKG